MCDIDKELVMRAAAHFATYAAERDPPRVEEFTAGLIARALRAKVAALPAAAAADSVLKRALDILAAKGALNSSKTENPSKLFALFLASPDQIFNNDEITAATGLDPRIGHITRLLNRFLKMHLIERVSPGRYRLGKAALS